MEYYYRVTLCLLVFMILCNHNKCFGCLEKERIALLELKNGLLKNSRNTSYYDLLSTWDLDVEKENDCCAWERVVCNTTSNQVVQLSLGRAFEDSNAFGDMQYLNVSLFLPFDALQHLDLSFNHLTNLEGFCELKNLGDLDLRGNKFKGMLPPCFSNITSLRRLDLSDNRMSGKIPSSFISNLKSLEYISLSENQFDGLHFISPLSNQLKFLSLSNCNLNMSMTGLLKFLHNQHNLEYLRLSHNKLHGRFPNWLVENNTRLSELLLRDNSFTGQIHFGFVSLSLYKFDISNNQFHGKLQTDFGVVLSKLGYLNVSRNNFEGTLPTSLGNMKDLVVLDFSINEFSGEIPESWAFNLKGLTILILSYNRLSGRISPSLFNLTSLILIRLSNNRFTNNSIPNYIVEPTNLVTLDVGQNNISGRIPFWISQLRSLKTLILQYNSFHGPIPLGLCNSSKIEFLDLSHNHLSGSIPYCLNLTSLKYMYLQGNNIFGSIPKAILQSRNLITLDLNQNDLSGNIPDWLGLMSNLRVLSLKGNSLSGPVSNQLCQLENVRLLDLSDNNFFGPIPPCFSNSSFGKSGLDELVFKDQKIYYYLFRGISYRDKELYELSLSGYEEFFQKGIYVDNLNTFYVIDLSCNQLTGTIPDDIGALTMIIALNLSNNHLIGSIPRTFSNLRQVESMDLSHNKLTGEIPSELTDLSELVIFDVSYNNLSGEVPDGGQFSTFDVSRYIGNSFLCGPPLQTPCKTSTNSTTDVTLAGSSVSSKIDLISLFVSLAASFIIMT